MPSSSTTSDSNINYEGTTISNDNNIKEGMKSTSNNNNMNEDHVTVFVAYNGSWEYDRKEWFFENSKSSIMVVPKHITLLEITDILHKQLSVRKELYRLKLEVHYRTGSPWFPVTEIKNDQDLSVFISETSKTKLPLCVTRIDDGEIKFDDFYGESSCDDDEERRKDHVRVLVAYNGKWRWDGEKWLFENSKGLIIDVSKYITLSVITEILCEKTEVDRDSYDLKLEVHYGAGSPWFPIIEIEDEHDLSEFILESWKTKLPLCVTRVAKVVVVKGTGREVGSVEKRLIKAIQKNDWVKAIHFAVGLYNDIEVVRDILKGINSELLVTTVANDGFTPAHTAALFGNTEALKMMFDSNPKCLINDDGDGWLPIHYSLELPAIKTFDYLFKQMKSNKDNYGTTFSDMVDPCLLYRVIDAGIIDVAYELINDYPSLATTTFNDRTALECIIRKPELFYSGTHYNLFQRFVYHRLGKKMV